MDRREIILQGLDLPNLQGIEIGALSKPLVRRGDGPIKYVDHADKEALMAKYKGNPYYDLNDFVNVDVVLNSNGLKDSLNGFVADYIIASHVIEHVPDLIRWLEDLRSVLKTGGEIRLAIPDKRFIFDHFRQETQLADVLAAFLQKDERPGARAIIDYQVHAIAIDAASVWRGQIGAQPPFSPETISKAMASAKRARDENIYEDAHCWVFTPSSFAALMEVLTRTGLVHLECIRLIDTPKYGIEFFVHLKACHSLDQSAKSWKNAAQEIQNKLISGENDTQLDNIRNRLRKIENSQLELVKILETELKYHHSEPSSPHVNFYPETNFHLTNEFLSTQLWRYSSTADPATVTSLQLMSTGDIGIYDHPNEAKWTFDGQILTFFDIHGRETVRFEQVLQIDGRVRLLGPYLLDPNANLILCLESWRRIGYVTPEHIQNKLAQFDLSKSAR